MTRAEALSLGYCPRCASHGQPDKCGVFTISADADCNLDPHYGEWLRQNFRLKGPRLADDLGIFEGVQPRGK